MRRFTLPVAVALTLLVIGLVGDRGRRSGEPAILERAEVIESFDPVLTRPVDTSRFTPPTNVVVNEAAGEDPSIVQSEVAIWVSGDEVVVGWNDGTVFAGGPSATGVGYSSDRGDTWTDIGSPPVSAQLMPFGDPTVVRTSTGTWLVASLNGGSAGGNAVQRAVSIGGVLSFTGGVAVSDPTSFADKEYLEYDPSTDTVYLSYTGSGGIYFTRSVDDGLTWAPAQLLDEGGVGAYPAVGVDGEVYVSWTTGLGSGSEELRLAYSPDGGVTFPGSPSVITTTANGAAAAPLCFNRSFNPLFPSCDVDRSSSLYRGRLYAVFSDGPAGEQDALLRFSDDHGVTWSAPLTLNDDTTSDQYWPQVRVSDTDGRVLVGWFDRRNDPLDQGLTDFYVTMSLPGGESFGPNRRASDMSVSWCGVPANASPNFGDYVDVALDAWSSFLVFSDARQGGPDVVFTRIDDRHLIDVTFAGNAQSTDGDGTAWLIPNAARTTLSPAPVLDGDVQLIAQATAMALLATPIEHDGVFELAGASLSGAFTVSSFLGEMDVVLTLSRVSPTEISLDVQTTTDASLADLDLPADFQPRFTITGTSPGQVEIDGALTVITSQGTQILRTEGTLSLDGAPGLSLTAPHEFSVSAAVDEAADLAFETWTTVTVLDAVDVTEPAPAVVSANTFPQVTVRAAPNPLTSDTAIRYVTERETSGAIRIFSASGRLVRTLAERRFDAGEGMIPFDGRDDAGRELAPGAYFVRFETELLAAGGKLLILE